MRETRTANERDKILSSLTKGSNAKPSTKGLIYHVDLVVSDFSKSAKFYEGFLGWLGYRTIGYWAKEQVAGWGIKGCNLWLSQRSEKFAEHRYHRKHVGVNHVAFHADSRKTVDQFYMEYLRPNKIPVLYGGPKDYPDYSKGYYAVYFEDPDRIKLELAYVPVFRGFEEDSR